MRVRIDNIAAAIRTLQTITGETNFTPSLTSDLQPLLQSLTDRSIIVHLRTQPDTRTYLAQVSVPVPTDLPLIGGIHYHHGTCTDTNPVTAILYALHTASGNELQEGEYPT